MKYSGNFGPGKDKLYSDLYILQEGKCALCGEFRRTLIMDHDHRTSEYRGLLCESCNSWLGHHLDRKGLAFILNALRYLTNPPARSILHPREGEKRCAMCNLVKPLSGFYVRNGRPNSYCRECQTKYNKERYAQKNSKSR